MTRSGSLVIEGANTSWEQRVFDYLRERPRTEPRGIDLAFDIERRTFESDPLHEKPPRGRGWRGTLRWIWRVATWPWWDPPLVPEQSWRLEGVRLYDVTVGATITYAEPRAEIPFTWQRQVALHEMPSFYCGDVPEGADFGSWMRELLLARKMRRLYGPCADCEGMGI